MIERQMVFVKYTIFIESLLYSGYNIVNDMTLASFILHFGQHQEAVKIGWRTEVLLCRSI